MRDRSTPALIAEAIGTFLIFFVGAASIVLGDWIMGKITVPRALGDAASCSSHSLVGRIA